MNSCLGFRPFISTPTYPYVSFESLGYFCLFRMDAFLDHEVEYIIIVNDENFFSWDSIGDKFEYNFVGEPDFLKENLFRTGASTKLSYW